MRYDLLRRAAQRVNDEMRWDDTMGYGINWDDDELMLRCDIILFRELIFDS